MPTKEEKAAEPRVVATLEGLKREYGPKRGEELYYQLGEALGSVSRSTGVNYTPDISLVGIDRDQQAAVDKAFAAADKGKDKE